MLQGPDAFFVSGKRALKFGCEAGTTTCVITELKIDGGKDIVVDKKAYTLSFNDGDGAFFVMENLPGKSKKAHGDMFHLRVIDDDTFEVWVFAADARVEFSRRK